MTDTYGDFLASKRAVFQGAGIDVAADALHPSLFPFQRKLTSWALRKGRAALFTATGTGKTRMSLSWSQEIAKRFGPVLIVAPLVVAQQTVAEAERLGIGAVYLREQSEVPDITVTNYEMVDHFAVHGFAGVVIDESSCLKSYEAKRTRQFIDRFADTPYRLACTATPAPNDVQEFANHAEFLGICPRREMLATFFIHDDSGWRLKGHAREPFYRWLASWAMALDRPSDIGESDEGYILPDLSVTYHAVATDYVPTGQLFATGLKGVSDRAKVRKGTSVARVERAVELIRAEPGEQWIAWCGLNEESTALATALATDAVEVTGSMTPDEKTERIQAFIRGDYRVAVTKGKIAGFGMNLQNATRQVFVGLSDSYELYHQCIRRSWRFGQTHPVRVHVVTSDLERPIYDNVLAKEAEAIRAQRALVAGAQAYERDELAGIVKVDYQASEPMRLPDWLQEAVAV